MLLNPTEGTNIRGDCAGRPPSGALPAAPMVVGSRARLRLPGWMIIGSTGRNSGKTEFACGVIRAFHRQHPIVGVKVTTIPDGESTCPRGGEGCGVCTTLHGDFHIQEERGDQPGKDTTRMLESGARRVFWLRCKRQTLRAALGALAPRLGRGVFVIAESNSLVQVIEPDLFLMVRSSGSPSVKPSAAEVLLLAQRTVLSTGNAFDLTPRHLAVVDGVWRLAETCMPVHGGTA